VRPFYQTREQKTDLRLPSQNPFDFPVKQVVTYPCLQGREKPAREGWAISLKGEKGTSQMPIFRNSVNQTKFNKKAQLPYELRLKDFEMAMQDVYDFFYDVNSHLAKRGLQRLDDMLRPAIMSGVLSDMLAASLAKHSRVLTENRYFNGHPDLVLQGIYPGNAVKAGEEGVEIKTTRKTGGAVDPHGARNQWMCVFVYDVDTE